MLSVESAMRSVDKDWHLMKGEPLEGCDLLYPGEAICFSPLGKLTDDGASVKLAQLTSLFDTVKGARIGPGTADQMAGQEAERLLRNGACRAFPDDSQRLVYVKLRVSGVTPVPGNEIVGLTHHMCVPKTVTVGQLCYFIAKGYKSFLEHAQSHKVMQLSYSVRHYRFSQAVLCEIVLTDELKDGLCVWEARIRHQAEECTTSMPRSNTSASLGSDVTVQSRPALTGHKSQEPQTRPLLAQPKPKARHTESKHDTMSAGEEKMQEEPLAIQVARRMEEMGRAKTGYNAFRQDPRIGQYYSGRS